MADPFERVADKYIAGEKEARDLFPAPKVTAPQQFPFTEYFQKKERKPPMEYPKPFPPLTPTKPPIEPPLKPPREPLMTFPPPTEEALSSLWSGLGTIGLGAAAVLLEGMEQTFTSIGALLTKPFRLKEPIERPRAEKLIPLISYYPGGAEYKAYEKWKGSPKEPTTLIPLPSWRQMGALLKPLLKNDIILNALGIDVSKWEEPERFEWARLGMGDMAELAPLLFIGGGAGKKPLEEALRITTQQMAKGKTGAEAMNIAFDQLAKKGLMPKIKITPAVAKVKPKAPPIKPPVAPPVKPAVPEVKPVVKPPTVELPVTPKPEVPPVKPPIPSGVIEAVAEDPVIKLTTLVKAAKPIRKETELLKHEELTKRVATAAGMLEKGEAREAFLRSKGGLKGKLPQAEFTPPEVGLTPDDISNLFNRIRDSETPYFQKLNTSEALEKLLLGQIPTRGDIARLEEVFGTDLVRAILAKRPLREKAWETFLDVWNIPRAVLASWDLSAPLRQGAVLAPKHFKEWARGLVPMVRAFWKEKYALDMDRIIQTSKYAELRAESGLFHAPITGVGAKLTAREEVFVSNLARYIPLVRRSERAYITYLNKLRADTFDSMVSMWERTGFEATVKDYKELAKFINNASGRGSLGKLEESAPFLSGIFFSPRLQASRIRIAESLLTGTAPVRKEVAKTLAAFMGTGLLILGLADLAGAEVGNNPLSADFGKIRIGKTRLDIWGGFQQYARFISTLIMGMKKSTISGQTYEANRMQIVQQFVRSKLMPSLSFFYDLLAGRTYIGEKMEMDIQQAYQRLAPMFVQDMVDAINAEGLIGGFIASPGMLGVGIVSYDLPNWTELEGYFKLETTAERNAYRIANPENEAKLFILGRFTILKTPAARAAVLRLMEEHKIKPEDIRGYENVFGEGAKPIPTQVGVPPAYTGKPQTWENIKTDLGSPLLKALNRLWYEGGSLTPDEINKLQRIHSDYPLGYRDFNSWVKSGLRQFFENSIKRD